MIFIFVIQFKNPLQNIIIVYMVFSNMSLYHLKTMVMVKKNPGTCKDKTGRSSDTHSDACIYLFDNVILVPEGLRRFILEILKKQSALQLLESQKFIGHSTYLSFCDDGFFSASLLCLNTD